MKKFLIPALLLLLLAVNNIHAQAVKTPVSHKEVTPVLVAGKSGGTITKEELFGAKLTTADPKIEITGFTISLIAEGKDVLEYSTDANVITNDMKLGIRKYPSNTKIVFTNIKSKGGGLLSDVTLIIK